MAAKHTPGPWLVHSDSTDVVRVDIDGTGSRLIADAGFGPSDEVAEANARLIAAAPDLLKACQQAIVALKGREHDGFLRDAIAKATGEQA